MKSRRVFWLIIFLCGIGLIGFSRYVTNQVEQGKVKIANAQEKVDTGKSLFSSDPFTQQIGKGVTSGAQKKINAGQAEVDYYEKVAMWTMVGGIACIIVGFGGFISSGSKKRR